MVTTNSDHNKPVARNFLRRNFCVEEPNQVWVTDLTYIQTQAGWLYLVVFIDLFSRHIVGWSMGNNMESSLMIRALEMGIRNRVPRPI
ncbi:MAG: DDE-type integrase/transposase/recombinase [Gammaproteobacteria bacterium]|nr:DDE-type integrase/transposase/recombinase [Gammaproteobacteria bacterium]